MAPHAGEPLSRVARRERFRPSAGPAVLLVLAGLVLAEPALGQEEAAADTARRPAVDTTRADTAAARQGPAKPFPAALLGPAGEARLVFRCDSECLLSNPWLNLAELLTEMVPGLTPVRGSYFGGPHHVAIGGFGPGFVRVLVDGRELSPLGSAQADLLRISLVSLDRVRVYRAADGLIVDASTRRHGGSDAYSRIAGATGQPNVELLRAIFVNGLGRDFAVGGALDLLDIVAAGETNRLDFQARASWMPGSGATGIELEYGSESLLREAADSVDLDRRQFTLRARSRFSDHVQGEIVTGTEALSSEETTLQDVTHGSASLAVRAGVIAAQAGVRLRDDEAYPHVELRGRTGLHPGPLALDVAVERASWEEFSTASVSAGAELEARVLVPLTLRVEGATGTRGVPRPLDDRADSLSFDAVSAGAAIDLGPFRIRGRRDWQSVSRRLSFQAPFDRGLEPAPGADVTAWELGASGPLVPLGVIIPGLDPVTATGFWRRQEAEDGPALYLPRDLLGGRLAFRDSFFGGNLEITASGSLEHRSRTPVIRMGETDPVLLPSYTWWSGHLGFRIADFRVFWRFINPAGLPAAEVPEIAFPVQVNVFGIRWEFFN